MIIQNEVSDMEKAGKVKLNIFGWATLAVINDAAERIRKEADPKFDMKDISYDDKEVYAMLARGETVGVFQLEGQGVRELLKNFIPTCLDDLTTLNALYRPGSVKGGMPGEFCDRRHGRKQVRYPHRKLEDILKETYGLILYQEQIIQIAMRLAGYSHGSADELLKAVGKKKSLTEKHKTVFTEGDEEIPGTRKLGVDDKTALEIYSLIEKSGEYGVSKSHSADCAVITYQTAYLRLKYFPQYLCALMNYPVRGTGRSLYIKDARRMGIDIKVPDINCSNLTFEYFPPEKGTDSEKYPRGYILWGLGAISDLPAQAAAEIVREREKKGEFKDIVDFCKRIDLRVANKMMIDALIYSGAFDCFGVSRREFLFISKDTSLLLSYLHTNSPMEHMPEEFPSGNEEDETVESKELRLSIAEFEVLLAEKKSLSLYVSGHPLTSAHKFTNNFFLNTSDVRAGRLEDTVKVLGIITDVEMKPTAGQDMAEFELEDDKGRVRCILFTDEFAKYRECLYTEDICLVEGRWADSDEEEAYIKVAAVYPFMEAIENYIPSVKRYFQRDAWAMLKKGYPVEDITEMTKLSLDEINKLKQLKSPPRAAD